MASQEKLFVRNKTNPSPDGKGGERSFCEGTKNSPRGGGEESRTKRTKNRKEKKDREKIFLNTTVDESGLPGTQNWFLMDSREICSPTWDS